MQYSIVALRDVFEDNEIFRFDADYYYPPPYNLYKKIKGSKFVRVKECFTVTKLAGFEYTEYFTDKSMSADDFYLVLTSKNIQNEELVLDGCLKIEKTVADNHLRRSKLKKGDIVLSYTGEYRRALVLENDGFQLGPNICLLRVKEKTVSPFYLSTFFNSKVGQLLLDREKTLSAQPTVAMSRIREIPIPLLSPIFQTRIETLVVDSKKQLQNAKNVYATVEEYLLSKLGLATWKPKNSLSFVKAFSVTQSAGRIDAEYFQPKYEEIVRAIKNGQTFAQLGDIVSIKKCVEPGSEVYQGSGIPFLRVSNLSKLGINQDNQQFLPESLYNELKTNQPHQGDILVSKDASPGIAYYLSSEPGKMIPSSGILRLRVKDGVEVLPEYLTLVLNSLVVQQQIERDAGGSIINHWRVDQVRNTLIPVLPLKQQKEISEKIKASFVSREKSKQLLNIAKYGVELAIEKSEKEAENWIKANCTT